MVFSCGLVGAGGLLRLARCTHHMALQMFGFHMCTAHQTQNRAGPLGRRRPSARHLLPTRREVKTNLGELWEPGLFSCCRCTRLSASGFSFFPFAAEALAGISAPFSQP